MRQIGVITGLNVETQAIKRAVRLERFEDRVFVAAAGGDRDRISELAQEFAAHGADTLLSVGLAGALSDELKTSDAVVPARVVFADADAVSTDPVLSALIAKGLDPETAANGDLLCTEHEIADAQEKRRLHAATGAIAADMESGHLARAAAQAGLPFAALRIVLDEADDSLPPSVLGLMRNDGTTDQAQLMKNIARRPSDLPPLVGLMVDSIAALNRLSRVARPVFRELL